MNQQTKPNYEEELKKEIKRLEVKYERKPTKTTKALLQAQLLGYQKAKEEIIRKIKNIIRNGTDFDSVIYALNSIINSLEGGEIEEGFEDKISKLKREYSEGLSKL